MAGKGGNQPPRRPAAVSNPQSGQRTDGGPGSSKQPIRVPTGGAYGEAGASAAQQAAAPMAGGGPQGPGGGGGAPATPMGGGAFGPTQRPTEPLGAPSAMANPMAADPQATLRMLYSVFPHPNIRKLIDIRPGDIR